MNCSRNLIKDLVTLNTPRCSLGQGCSCPTSLILLAIRKILYLSLADLLMRLLILLLMHIRGLCHGRSSNQIHPIEPFLELWFFCLVGIIRITVLKPVWVSIVEGCQLLDLLKNFFHGRWRSGQLCMPISTIRTIWTKSQFIPII